MSIVTFTLLLSGCTHVLVASLNSITLTQTFVQDEKLYLMGDFNSKSHDQVKNIIEDNPNIDTIVLTAHSGSLDDETTFKLGRYIRSKGLNTHLINTSVIASGAVDLFLSGVHRTIEDGAQLGVHSWSDGSKQAKDFPRDHPDHTLNADYIKDMLADDKFYWLTIYSAPADSIYWMKDKEIKKYNINTVSFLPPSNDKTPFGNDFIEERREILGY